MVAVWAVGGVEGKGLIAGVSVGGIDVGAGAYCCGLNEGGMCEEVIGCREFRSGGRVAGEGKRG